jgi:hypothetical protein
VRATYAALAAVALLAGCGIGGNDDPAATRSDRTVTTSVPSKAVAKSKAEGAITSACIKRTDGTADCTFTFAGQKPIVCRNMRFSEVREIRARLASAHPEISLVC